MYQVFIVSVHKHITYLTLFEKSVIKLEQTITNVVLIQQCLLLRWCLKDGFGVYVLNKRCFEVSHLNHEIKTFLIRQNSSANFRPQFLLLLSSTTQLLVVLFSFILHLSLHSFLSLLSSFCNCLISLHRSLFSNCL